MSDLQRDIGRLEEAVDYLKSDMRATRDDVAEIKDILAQARGGWRTMLAIGTLAGSIGAGVMKLITMLKGGG